MTISSRTPEGSQNDCPICGNQVCLDPSRPPGDAPCPFCGTLLWFIEASTGWRVYESKVVIPREYIAEIICNNYGIRKGGIFRATSFIKALGGDSLDIVELIMELEKEFHIPFPGDAAKTIKTVEEIVDYILQKRSDAMRSPNYSQFQPGDQVKVVDGTFVGKPGIVVSRAQALALSGRQQLEFLIDPKNSFWVMITIFGRRVPVNLQSDQLEAQEP